MTKKNTQEIFNEENDAVHETMALIQKEGMKPTKEEIDAMEAGAGGEATIKKDSTEDVTKKPEGEAPKKEEAPAHGASGEASMALQLTVMGLFVLFDFGKNVIENAATKGKMINPSWYGTTNNIISLAFGFGFTYVKMGFAGIKQICDYEGILKYAMPALFFGLQNNMMTLGNLYLSGSLKKVLSQFRIPITAVVSGFVMGTKYTNLQKLVITLITTSVWVFVVIVEGGGNLFKSGDAEKDANITIGLIIAVMANLFAVFATVVTEKFLKKDKSTPFYIQLSQVMITQLVIAICCFFFFTHIVVGGICNGLLKLTGIAKTDKEANKVYDMNNPYVYKSNLQMAGTGYPFATLEKPYKEGDDSSDNRDTLAYNNLRAQLATIFKAESFDTSNSKFETTYKGTFETAYKNAAAVYNAELNFAKVTKDVMNLGFAGDSLDGNEASIKTAIEPFAKDAEEAGNLAQKVHVARETLKNAKDEAAAANKKLELENVAFAWLKKSENEVHSAKIALRKLIVEYREALKDGMKLDALYEVENGDFNAPEVEDDKDQTKKNVESAQAAHKKFLFELFQNRAFTKEMILSDLGRKLFAYKFTEYVEAVKKVEKNGEVAGKYPFSQAVKSQLTEDLKNNFVISSQKLQEADKDGDGAHGLVFSDMKYKKGEYVKENAPGLIRAVYKKEKNGYVTKSIMYQIGYAEKGEIKDTMTLFKYTKTAGDEKDFYGKPVVSRSYFDGKRTPVATCDKDIYEAKKQISDKIKVETLACKSEDGKDIKLTLQPGKFGAGTSAGPNFVCDHRCEYTNGKAAADKDFAFAEFFALTFGAPLFQPKNTKDDVSRYAFIPTNAFDGQDYIYGIGFGAYAGFFDSALVFFAMVANIASMWMSALITKVLSSLTKTIVGAVALAVINVVEYLVVFSPSRKAKIVPFNFIMALVGVIVSAVTFSQLPKAPKVAPKKD